MPPTLDSILNQEKNNHSFDFEIILIDDGSTDSTQEVIEKNYLHKDSEKFDTRLSYFRKKNEERSVARNFGISKAKGKYILFFDSDDFMKPFHLKILYETIQAQPKTTFLATKFEFKAEGKIFPSHIAHLKEDFYDYKLILEGSYFGTLVCFDRCLIDTEIGLKPFPKEFSICEDWIFLFRNLYAHQAKVYLIDKTTITVNDHPHRSMANNQKVIEARLEAMRLLEKELKLSAFEISILRGHSYQFCAVHAYLDKNKKQAFHFWKKMVSEMGYSKSSVVLLVKILIGKFFIDKLR